MTTLAAFAAVNDGEISKNIVNIIEFLTTKNWRGLLNIALKSNDITSIEFYEIFKNLSPKTKTEFLNHREVKTGNSLFHIMYRDDIFKIISAIKKESRRLEVLNIKNQNDRAMLSWMRDNYLGMIKATPGGGLDTMIRGEVSRREQLRTAAKKSFRQRIFCPGACGKRIFDNHFGGW